MVLTTGFTSFIWDRRHINKVKLRLTLAIKSLLISGISQYVFSFTIQFTFN